MQIESPLSHLIRVLRKVRQTAEDARSPLSSSEAATRSTLIDPILTALGWDIANPNMVSLERTYSKARVDYALRDHVGADRVIVEAKKLGEELHHESKGFNIGFYAFQTKTKSIFLTDGACWNHFTEHDPERPEPTRKLNLSTDSLVECASYLIEHLDAARFWTDASVEVQLAERLEQVEKEFEELRRQLDDRAISVSAQPVQAGRAINGAAIKGLGETRDMPDPMDQRAASLTNSFRFEPLTKVLPGHVKPRALRTTSGELIPIRAWKHIIVEVAKYLAERNSLPALPLKDRAGRKIYLLTKEGPPPGRSFDMLPVGDETIYVDTNYSAKETIANAVHLLSQSQEGNVKAWEIGFPIDDAGESGVT